MGRKALAERVRGGRQLGQKIRPLPRGRHQRRASNAVGDLLVEDYNIRKFLKKTLYGAVCPRSRSSAATTSSPFGALRPSRYVIGKDGTQIESIARALR